MKAVIIAGIVCVLAVSCATGVKEQKKVIGSAEKLASDIAEFLNESRIEDAENRMLAEMRVSGTSGVFLINRRGETVRGYILDAGGEIVSYREDFKSLLLSNDDEIDEALIFYKDKMMGLVRIIRSVKKK